MSSACKFPIMYRKHISNMDIIYKIREKVVTILLIKKCYNSDEYIVYDPKNFDNCHTHVKHKRVARLIRDNVNYFRIPKSRNKKTIESHLRVATNKIYRERIQEILDDILHNINTKVGEELG